MTLINLIKPRLIMNINELGDCKFLQPPMGIGCPDGTFISSQTLLLY